MNQIRKKRLASDRKPLGRFLNRYSERSGIPEDGEERRQETPESECDAGWGRVCAFLQRLGKETNTGSLSLAHCDLTATDLLELGEALSCVPLLEILDLSWNGGIGGVALQGLLGKLHPTLTELHLVACQLTAADATALGGVVSSLPRLCVLDVSCNAQLSQEVDSGSFFQLAASLRHAFALTVLRLQACSLTPDGLGALGSSLDRLSSLRELDLSCNKTLSGGLHQLTPHLAHLTHLESLDLHVCCLTHSDLEALIGVLPSLMSLMELNLSSNKEVGGGVRPLVSVLPLTQMRHLPLNSCHLSQESLAALALAMPHLHVVDVSWSKVVGGHLALLLDPLQLSVILELRLSSCDITADDLCHLAAVSRRGRLSSLRVLDLSFNGSAGDEGWAALFAAGGLGSLEDIDVSLRPSTCAPCSAWLPTLLCALPRLLVLRRLGMQRWTVSPQERRQLDQCLRERSVLLELDETWEGAEERCPEE